MIQVLLVDDHALLRAGLRGLLSKATDVRVVGEAGDGREALALAESARPDVVLMDVGMPGLNGFEATRRLVEANPAVRVVALSMHTDPSFVSQMLRAGACGYLAKDCAFEELVDCVRTVATGSMYLGGSIAAAGGFEPAVRASDPRSPFEILTPREREVLQLVAEGLSSKEIGSQLGVSLKTVETHRQNLMDKLRVRSVAELTRHAIRAGLSPLDR